MVEHGVERCSHRVSTNSRNRNKFYNNSSREGNRMKIKKGIARERESERARKKEGRRKKRVYALLRTTGSGLSTDYVGNSERILYHVANEPRGVSRSLNFRGEIVLINETIERRRQSHPGVENKKKKKKQSSHRSTILCLVNGSSSDMTCF